MKRLNIAIVDDQKIIRQGLISLFDEYKREINVIIEASDGRDLIEKLNRESILPDVIILDLEMPRMDGIDTTAFLKKKYPEIKIVILTIHTAKEFIVHLIDEGAHGFLDKDTDIEIIIDAIYSVCETGYFFNELVSKELVGKLITQKKIKPMFHEAKLTEREIEVMRLVYREKSNIEIAELLFIEVQSVSNYKNTVIEKTKSRNIIGAVMYLVKNGLVSTDA